MKALLLVACAALLVSAAAIAAPPPGKGKTGTTTTTSTTATVPCKKTAAVVLTGTLAADGTLTALSVNVTGSNKAGQAYKKGTQPVSVTVTAKTKVSRNGKVKADALKSGDKVNILAKGCPIAATKVTAHPAG